MDHDYHLLIHESQGELRSGRLLLGGFTVAFILTCSGSNGPDDDLVPIAARISIDSTVAQAGRLITIPIRLTAGPHVEAAIDSIQAFALSLYYDHTALQFIEASYGDATSDWGTLSYSGSGRNNLVKTRTTLRLIGRRGSPTQFMPYGEIATISFYAIPPDGVPVREAGIGFQSVECKDNTVTDAADGDLLHFMQALRSGDSSDALSDTFSCPRRYSITSDLEFVSGAVRIISDSQATSRGDLNFDGLVDVADVSVFVRRIFRNDTSFSDDSLARDRQLRALDVNWDGEPLQVSDLEMVMRLAFEGYDPAEPLWPIAGYALFELSAESYGMRAVMQSQVPITMFYLDIEHGFRDTLQCEYDTGAVAYCSTRSLGTHTIIVLDDLDRGGIANSFRPLELVVRTSPGEPVSVRDLQASTRPGVAVHVYDSGCDNCPPEPN